VAFGGAGPLHSTLIADACAIPEVIVPREPGTFSSLGMVIAEDAHHTQASFLGSLDAVDSGELGRRLEELRRAAEAGIGDAAGACEIRRTATMRYVLQEWGIRVPLPDGAPDKPWLEQLRQRFHAAHHERYGFSRPDKPVELVTLYVDSALPMPEPLLERPERGGRDPGAARTGAAAVVLEPDGTAVDVPVLSRSRLRAGNVLDGPVIVTEPLCTTFVHPGWAGVVDDEGNLVLRAGEARS
jgi:N-methylhydantoinase A